MVITFLNVPESQREKFKEKAWRTWQSIREDLLVLYGYASCYETRKWLHDNYGTNKGLTCDEVWREIDRIRSEYGLGIDYVAPRTFEDQDEGYIRYQFAYGGPQYELRFYDSGRVEFAYLDWFVGVGFDVTDDEVVKAVREYFEDIGLFESLREEVKRC